MGAQESKGTGGNASNAPDVPDYYQVLEVSEEATSDEIRKSFRRLAILHHPDKNPNDIEAATKRFATMQQAYEVLSDEQERAWYDSHRASLVPEPEASAVFEDIRKGGTTSRKRMNDPGLSVSHILRFMDPSGWSSMDDSPYGFFSVNNNLFARLSADEATGHTEEAISYPSFGSSSWPWIPVNKDREHEAARTFYNTWLSFSTEKDFAWKDHYNVNEAPDRRVRRLMEKENKKARDDARRDYNDTVRSLVRFLRKRDPRYKVYLSEQASAGTKESKLNDKRAAQKRNEAGDSYIEQEWQRASTTSPGAKAHEEWGDGEWEEAEGAEEFECVACGKSFRSEQAWTNHERSRKHLKEVEMLMREMRLENQELDLTQGLSEDEDQETVSTPSNEPPMSGEVNMESIVDPSDEASGSENNAPNVKLSTGRKKGKKKRSATGTPLADDTLDSNDLRLQEPKAEPMQQDEAESRIPRNDEGVSTRELSKKEKRRAKESAKKEKQTEQVCNVCSERFESRTKLFSHIHETGHAAVQSNQNDIIPESGQQKTREGKKGRKPKQ